MKGVIKCILLFLGILSVTLLAEPATGYKIYAFGNTLDVWQNGAWKTILPFGNSKYSCCNSRIYPDRAGNFAFRAASPSSWISSYVYYNGSYDGGDYWYATMDTKIDPFDGPLAFDANNTACSTRRFSKTQVLGPWVWCQQDRIGVLPAYAKDITSFRQGRALVIVGEFSQVQPTSRNDNGRDIQGSYINVSNVALWDLKTQTWQPMGAGIPTAVPERIVSSADGTQLVALSDGDTVWRWNGTSKSWVAHPLTLTSKYGAPSISDLALGDNKLFIVGNFDTVNGVTVKNVTQISFGPKGALTIAGIGLGLPGVAPKTVVARSATQVFIGGSGKGNKKVVYEWRQGRKNPWGRIGPIGVSDPDGTGSITGLAVI